MRKTFRAMAALGAACAVLAGPAAHADKLENIPLEWKPTSPLSERAPVDVKGLEGIRIQVEPFTDKREDRELIGRNVNKAPIRKVTTNEDVPRFVTYHTKSLLSAMGLNIVESGGDYLVKGEVKKYFAEEASRYNASVELRISLTTPDGKVLWVVETEGTSSRYGIGYKRDNYYEVLSDALIGAVHEVVRNQNFRKALTAK
ncbi:MAG TPA: hypothetical protein VFV71_01710 [Burkholderiales bacterium]|nr:hypothetical protein [Burkholderiales bacterium]